MRYISIDIETTGLDKENDQILEIGAVIEDTKNLLPIEELPKYKAIINHSRLSGSPFALHMNSRIIETLKNIPKSGEERKDYMIKHNIMTLESLPLSFYSFLLQNGYNDNESGIHIIPAGKNFSSFDRQFLEKIPNFTSYINFSHRTIDPANLFIDFNIDEEIPSLNECLKRAGVDKEVSHNALDDALDVVRVLRSKY